MIESLVQATKNFFQHQLRENSIEKRLQKAEIMHKTHIDLLHGESTPAYFYLHEAFLSKTALALLGDDFLDQETIEDLSKEITNLIAGSAKLLSETHASGYFDIGIPDYVGEEAPQDIGTQRAFYIDDTLMLSIVLDKG